jgi:DNA-binding GntR family transcriptional regulator
LKPDLSERIAGGDARSSSAAQREWNVPQLNVDMEAIDGAGTDTLVGQAARAIHQDIINGQLPAGARLNVRELASRYVVGATPIREALMRLSTTGFVTVLPNRGFRVATLSAADLIDVITIRQVVEVAALRRAMKRGDAAWEAGIIGALHQIESLANDARRQGVAWLAAIDPVHRAFHTALILACEAPRMVQLHWMFYDQTFRYRQAMYGNLPGLDDFVAEHQALAAAVLRRDEGAAAHLQRHLTRTLREVYPDSAVPESI